MKVFNIGMTLLGIISTILVSCSTLPEKEELKCIEIGGKWVNGQGCNLDK